MIRWLGACLLSAAAPLPATAAPSHLDSIAQRGTLRVCSTGDYLPYSLLPRTAATRASTSPWRNRSRPAWRCR
nr:hypothetical protein [Xanthomonas translucens]